MNVIPIEINTRPSNLITAPSSAPLELIDRNKLIHPSIQRESQCHLLDKQTPRCELFVEN